jgi:uncharacterized peroxidase-related enzyme
VFVEPVDESADEAVAAIQAAERERLGYVPNYARLFSLRPDVYDAWRQLNGAIRGSMDLRRYELVTLAAARRLRSSYCALAHGTILAERFLAPAAVGSLAVDGAADELDDVDRAIVDLATKVVDDATSVTEADIARLRDAGLSDREIFDVVLAATARCFFSKTLDAMGVEPDPEYRALEDGLRDALTVGRPIATG